MTTMASGPRTKRVWRAGVRFDCAECGLLWRDDAEHAPVHSALCPDCDGILRLVGLGDYVVQKAKWFRCLSCSELWMWRRQELARTRPRSGFDQYA
jgi:predicted RNA-binding Zn-ribbon protein involved in translation (DUF1610 family)